MAASDLLTRIVISAQDNASSVIGKVGAALTALGGLGLFKGAVQSAADFEEALDKIQARTGANAEEMARFEAAAKQAGATTKYTATEAAQGLEILGAAGLSATDSIKTLPAVLALAQSESISLDKAAQLITDSVSIMGLGFEDAGRAADIMVKSANLSNLTATQVGEALKYAGGEAKNAGLSFEETAAYLDVLAKNGIRGEQAGTMLRTVFAALTNPVSEARKELSSLGIVSTDITTVFGELAKKGVDGQAAIRAFGVEAGPAVRTIIKEGKDAIDGFTQSIYEADGAAQSSSETMSGNLKGAVATLSSAWDAMRNRLVEPLLVPLTNQANGLAKSFSDFTASGSMAALRDGMAAIGDNLGKISFVAASAGLAALAKGALNSAAAFHAQRVAAAEAAAALEAQAAAQQMATVEAAIAAEANLAAARLSAGTAQATMARAEAEVAATEASLASARASVAAAEAAGVSADVRAAAESALQSALLARIAAEERLVMVDAQLTAAQQGLTAATIASAEASATLAAAEAARVASTGALATAVRLLLNPMNALMGAMTAVIGFQIGAWMRDAAKAAEAWYNPLLYVKKGLENVDANLRVLSSVYDEFRAAEDGLIGSLQKQADALKRVEEQTGYAFKSVKDLADAQEKGVVIFDQASGAYSRGAVSIEQAATASTSLSAQLMAQASVLTKLYEQEKKDADITQARHDLAVNLAKSLGGEADSLNAVAKAMQDQSVAAERSVAFEKALLQNAQARIASIQSEIDAGAELTAKQQIEMDSLFDLVKAKQQAIDAAQIAADATKLEATNAQLAADTFGDQSAKVSELATNHQRLNQELKDSAAIQREAATAQDALAGAEENLRQIAEDYTQAIISGSDKTGELAQQFADAKPKVDALKDAIAAGKVAAESDADTKERLRQASINLTDAIGDLVKKREAEQTAAERATNAIQAEGDLRTRHINNLANEARARGDVAGAIQLEQQAIQSEIDTLTASLAAKQAEVVAAQASAAAKLQEADADGLRTQEELAAIAVADEAVAAKQREVAAIQEAVRAKQEEANATQDLAQQQDVVTTGQTDWQSGAKKSADASQDLAESNRDVSSSFEQIMTRAGAAAAATGDYANAAQEAFLRVMATWKGGGLDTKTYLEAFQDLQDRAVSAASAAARYAEQIDTLADRQDLANQRYDSGVTGLSAYIGELEKASFNLEKLGAADLSDLNAAISAAKREMEDFADSAIDGLKSLQQEWADLSGQQIDAMLLEQEMERIQIETELAQAKKDNNAEAIAALEAQLNLIDQIHAKQLANLAEEEAAKAVADAEDAAREAERWANLSAEEQQNENALASLEDQLAAAILKRDELAKQSILTQIAAENARHEQAMANLSDEQKTLAGNLKQVDSPSASDTRTTASTAQAAAAQITKIVEIRFPPIGGQPAGKINVFPGQEDTVTQFLTAIGASKAVAA